MTKVQQANADHYSSDCPMAGRQIESGLSADPSGAPPKQPEHPDDAGCARRTGSDVHRAEVAESDLLSLERYARERADFRTRVIAHKRNRQVNVGPNTMWLFEDRLTVQYQVQEMLRTERIFEPEGIAEELAAYNPLIPDGSNWKVTFLIEYPDAEVRRVQLERLQRHRRPLLGAGC
jgi:hypothetical protein